MMRYARYGWSLVGFALLALVLTYPLQYALAQVSSLNYFDQCPGGAAACDNTLNIDGTLEFEDKPTVIDHGTATLTDGYVSVTTNLSSTVTCTAVVVDQTIAPNVAMVTALYTTGSATLELLAWELTTLGPSLVATTADPDVGWSCFGAD